MRLATILLATSIIALPASAQQPVPTEPEGQATAETPTPPPAPSVHDDEEVVVTGYVRELDILAGKSVISGEALQRDVRVQIGDSLTRLPGVSATSFTPGASRPVLRGLQGERVRVLTDGIGSIDVSNTSADHAVTIDPLTAERIEVLRGPAVLLFGGQASGGAVNVIDRRIPRRVPEPYHVDIVGALSSAADERSIGAAVDISLGGGFVLHADGSLRKTDNLRTGGHVLSSGLRAEQREIAEEELDEGHFEEAGEALALARLKGKIPNSATEQKSGGLGLAYIGDRLSLGASISRFESNYGVPMRPGANHHHGDEDEDEEEAEHGEAPVSIDLKQTRFDLRADYQLDGGFLDRVRLRIGSASYEHIEFEGADVGTVFNNKGYEGRLEFVQRDRNGWQGASGAQYYHRDFNAVGAEAFLPPNDTSQLGLFTLQEFDLGTVGMELAGRFERTEVEQKSAGIHRDFDAFSVAGGAFVEPAPRIKVGVNLSRTERAPSAEELFADGPHIATQSYEVGDPDLKKEIATGAEAYVRVERAGFEISATAYATWFTDFIFETATGEEQGELPVFQYFQRGARFTGFELEASARLFDAGGFRFVADGVADYVRATLKGAGPVPRIPPLRLLGGIEGQSDRLDGRLEVEWVADQKRVSDLETETDGFTLVNASLAWRPWGKDRETTVMVSANNIFDVEARRHASFTKDFVPLAGRDIRLSARFSF